jgi:hypothetical protein
MRVRRPRKREILSNTSILVPGKSKAGKEGGKVARTRGMRWYAEVRDCRPSSPEWGKERKEANKDVVYRLLQDSLGSAIAPLRIICFAPPF